MTPLPAGDLRFGRGETGLFKSAAIEFEPGQASAKHDLQFLQSLHLRRIIGDEAAQRLDLSAGSTGIAPVIFKIVQIPAEDVIAFSRFGVRNVGVESAQIAANLLSMGHPLG